MQNLNYFSTMKIRKTLEENLCEHFLSLIHIIIKIFFGQMGLTFLITLQENLQIFNVNPLIRNRMYFKHFNN